MALFTDFVFNDEAMLGSSLVCIIVLAMGVAALSLGLVLRPYRAMVSGQGIGSSARVMEKEAAGKVVACPAGKRV